MKLGRQRNGHKGRAAIRHYANQPANLRIAFVSISITEKCVATLILAKLMWSKNMNFSLRSIEINARKICCQYFQSLNLFIKVPDGSQLWKVLISCQFCVVHPTKWSICGRLVQLTQAVNILVQGQLLTYNEIRHEDEEPGEGHQCRHCHSRGIVLHNIALHSEAPYGHK